MPKIRIADNPGARHKTYLFWCPGCDMAHGPNDTWQFNGDVERPTLSPSVLVNQGRADPTSPVCHSFVRDGQIQFLPDCTHALAGKTVPLPDWPDSVEVN